MDTTIKIYPTQREIRGDRMKHYIYEILYSNGMRYHGVHSSKDPYSLDYIGSSKYTPNELVTDKAVMGIYKTREEANLAEEMFHNKIDIKNSKRYYNECNASATMSRAGMTKENNLSVVVQGRKMKNLIDNPTKAMLDGRIVRAKSMVGRTKHNHAPTASQSEKMSGRKHHNYSSTPYKFHHVENGWTIICDRQYMRDCFGINIKPLFKTKPC